MPSNGRPLEEEKYEKKKKKEEKERRGRRAFIFLNFLTEH
jgi:hypothetical protein